VIGRGATRGQWVRVTRPRQIRSRVVWRRVAMCPRGVVGRTGYHGMDSILPAPPMHLPRASTWPLMLLLAGATALAAEEPAPAEAPAPAAPAPEPASAEPAKFFDWKWEGAIGPIVSLSPEYSGSAARKVSVVPGFYLRYGRISISNASGFVTRRSNDDILRGLGLDMVRNNRVRVNLALRIDNGRRSSGSIEWAACPANHARLRSSEK